MLTAVLVLVSISCTVAGARSFSRSELQCPKNAVGACMTNVQKRTNDVGFCEEASAALDCVTDVLHVCYTGNDPAFLDALSSYDIAGLFQKMMTICS